MASKDWDDREYWGDDSKCVVCHADMGKSQVLVCSVTCEEISLLRDSYPLYDEENDCYA